ncbi:MFS transporter [Mesoterricola silvestris]|uniref:Multidrug resistance protein B n=1 Tax=Mesoterricola silvestris TaxID=2927979 RepID=A0AA48KDQ4_9BACT|nr:MFS transporter [Mesoterricola silvestris]BDU74678.1 multidrug resistance protein B [Mesoterricola silvestris]
MGRETDTGERRVVRALLAGICLPLLDATIVVLALDTFGQRFGAPLAHTQWVLSGYTLAAASAVPVCAWAANRIGVRRLWMGGLGVFLAGSCLSGCAGSLGGLVAARCLQGLGCGILTPTLQTALVRSMRPDRVRAALATAAVPAVVAPILGPLLGGLLLKAAGWRWLFLANLPLGLLALVTAHRGLPADEPLGRARFDAQGFLLLAPGLAAVTFGLAWVARNGWSGPGWALPVGLSLVGAFALRPAPADRESLVDLSLFRLRAFTGCGLTLFLSSAAFYGGLLLLPLNLGRGWGPTGVGALLAVQGVGALVARSRLAALSRILGDRALARASLVVAILATLAFAGPWGPPATALALAALLARGAGLGLVTLLTLSAAYQDLDKVQVAHASVVSRILNQMGAALGGVLAAALLQHLLQARAGPGMAHGVAALGLAAITAAALLPTGLLSGRERSG